MKGILILIIAVVFYSFLSSCATLHLFPDVVYYPEIKLDTLNKYDVNKHRTGYWVEYLNKNLLPAENKKEAVFYRYAYFENGIEIFPNWVGGIYAPSNTILKFEDRTHLAKKDTVVLLNGKHQVYNKMGVLIGEDYYTNGMLKYSKNYYKNGQLSEYVDYRKKYNQIPFSFLNIGYTKSRQLWANEYWYWKNGKSYTVKNWNTLSDSMK